GGDQGKPIVANDPSSPQAKAFLQIAKTLVANIEQGEQGNGGAAPSISSLLKKITDPLKKS
ncbi:MAG: ATP-binding protein, partial [Nitrospirota bacterium]|nr:ATP-binding protein [Nitrospirota bacterium]